MVSATTKLGGTASNVTVATIGHGLMMMTWTPNPVPDDQCFEAIKAGVDALPAGTKMLLNSGEFYAYDFGTGNLDMLSRFYAKYPEYADRTFLSVKGGVNFEKRGPDGSLECLRKSVDKIQHALGTTKKIDLFEPARLDSTVGIQKVMENLVILKNEGKFGHIGLSECNANTLRIAHAIHPITAIEIEVSPWSYDDNQKKVIATATELNITVAAYSPLGRGFLTGQIQKKSDLPEGDIRHRLTRFKDDEIMQYNFAIVDKIKTIAEKKGVTPAQLCLAWVSSLSPVMLPIPGSSKSTRTLENLEAGDIVLSADEVKTINEAVESHEVRGDRYFGMTDEEAHLWQ